MKKLFSLLVLLSVSALFLAGCGPREPLVKSVKKVVDLGALPLPNSNYQLHGYQVVNSVGHDHFIYLVESGGRPVAGSTVNRSRNQQVTSVLENAPLGESSSTSIVVNCDTEEQCARIAAAVRGVR